MKPARLQLAQEKLEGQKALERELGSAQLAQCSGSHPPPQTGLWASSPGGSSRPFPHPWEPGHRQARLLSPVSPCRLGAPSSGPPVLGKSRPF